MIPHVGQTVLVHGIKSNGADVHPAIITRNWSTGMDLNAGIIAVNLTIFPDDDAPIHRTSVPLCKDRATACGCGSQIAAYPTEA